MELRLHIEVSGTKEMPLYHWRLVELGLTSLELGTWAQRIGLPIAVSNKLEELRDQALVEVLSEVIQWAIGQIRFTLAIQRELSHDKRGKYVVQAWSLKTRPVFAQSSLVLLEPEEA